MHATETRQHRGEQHLAVALLIFAAVLRLSDPGITEFKRDEANLSQLALDLAQGRALPLLGIGSSANVPNTPWAVYLLAPAYLPGSNPALATWLTPRAYGSPSMT
jgi:hypothetical protein